jgi:hypothetical protein
VVVAVQVVSVLDLMPVLAVAAVVGFERAPGMACLGLGMARTLPEESMSADPEQNSGIRYLASCTEVCLLSSETGLRGVGSQAEAMWNIVEAKGFLRWTSAGTAMVVLGVYGCGQLQERHLKGLSEFDSVELGYFAGRKQVKFVDYL